MADTELLIIGTGIAGLSAALQAAATTKVRVLCKGEAAATNTSLAQGGLAAVLQAGDSITTHVADTLAAGSHQNKPEAVALVVQEAPGCISELLRLGVPFDRQDDGSLALGLEGGHSHHRIVHARDQTGHYIQQYLLQAVRRHPNISLHEHQVAMELILEEAGGRKRCVGIKVLDLEHSSLQHYYAKATILATGGAGQLYQHTTNPALATGDGLAMAQRAGAVLEGLAFVQFHPTALYDPGKPIFLISEAVRGFGAELVLPTGESFMHRYHPQAALAPRDVVSQAMHQEMERTGASCLYLDLRQLSITAFESNFPVISQQLQARGFDPRYNLVPVVPAAHYMCGGILTDLNGETTVPGLYACGECASTGLHGANRLASNSLPEGWIMGRRAAQHALSEGYRPLLGQAKQTPGYYVPLQPASPLAGLLREQLQEGMWQYAGIVRSQRGLRKCLRLLQCIQEEVADALASGALSQEWIELQNMATAGILVVQDALARPDSCGCHLMKSEGATDLDATAEMELSLPLNF